MAASPALRDTLAELATAVSGSNRARLAHGRLVAELESRALAVADSHLLLAVLDPARGTVIAATDARLADLRALDEPYFRQARHGSYVQYPYRSELLHGPTMTIGTPLRSAEGPLLGILVGWLDVAEIGAIVQQRSGLHGSDESYLVNPAGQFVTQPRLLGRPALLEAHLSSEAVRECLAGNSGISFAADYRGVPAITVYRWLPRHRLGLISKMDLAEALAPARAFGRTILLVSSLALLLASALALGLARSITRPVGALQAGVARFERGELDVRLPVRSNDVLGKLAGEFNNLAATITENERQLRLNALELEAKVAARTDQLRASEERTRSILASAQDAFIGMDAAGRISDWNPQAEATFGWSSSEALGQPMHQLIIPPQFHERHLQGLRHFLASGEGPLLNKRIEVTAVHRDGHELPVELTLSLVHLGDGVMFGAFLHDISERRRVADELQKAKDAAEAASRVKSEFLANMSHEIRTPMNGVLGTVGLLLESELGAEQRELAELARASGESLLGIIDDILDFSKAEAGKLRLEPLPIDLLLAVEEVAGMSAAKARAKDLDVIVRYPAQVPRHLIGDPGRIRQVLANLSNNAVKFTERGQVLIDVEALTQSEAEVVLRISIQDSGIGIPADKLEQLFEKFTQADASTTRRYGGTGLGLAISKQLVELMGGSIGALSRPGEGSTFWFTLRLPRQQASPERLPASGDLS
ncbi:MAG: ATP-binding protein, partial [Pseudomonas sp.]